MLVTDAEGYLLDANAAAERLTGRTAASLVGRRATSVVAEKDRRRSRRLRRPDGTKLEIDVEWAELSQDRRLLILREVSGRAASAPQLQRFWSTCADLLAIISVGDGKPRLLNGPAWRDTLGYEPAVLMRTRLADLAHPDDRARAPALKARPERGGNGHDGDGHDGDGHGPEARSFTSRYRHADGRWVWLSWNVVRDGDLDFAVARDVTREIEAAQALAQSERQLRLLVAGVVDYALFMLDPQGVVTNWNAGAQRIKGYRADEILGRHFSIFYTEADRAAGVPDRALKTAAEKGRFEAEGWRVRKDGSLFWAHVIIDAIHDETGQLVGFAKITRDTTERRQAQLELERARERLAQAQKLEAIGQLTGGVAHDFNNLLMVIGGQAQILRGRLAAVDPMVGRSLDAIDMAARRGQDLTRHLLAFARRQRLSPTDIVLPERALALRQLLAAGVGPAVRVGVDLPADLWRVRADASELELALLNMAVNARDAMPGGGDLSLEGANVTLAEDEVAEGPAGDYVALTLRDTGVGIPPDILAKVFEPFFTTKPVDRGAGLGLSQVYGFVQQSGGRVGIVSEMGQGTAITLYLPRVEGPLADEDAAAPAPADEAARRRAEVLVVEDNPHVADVAARLLAQLGHGVRVATSADAALTELESGKRPELLFSDMVMGGARNGLDLAREVRRRWPDLPVLLTTGYSAAAEKMPSGEFAVLPKPYGINELSRALNAALARSQPRSEA